MKVSVVVPVYGVEGFVERCVVALMEQTARDVEFVFVDDCSTDRSMAIVEQTVALYPDRQGQVKLLRHDRNRGLPSARNTGLEAATGEYVVHIDSDDYPEPRMIEAMTDCAEATGADMVWCDFFISSDSGDRLMTTPNIADASEATIEMLCGGMKYNVWNKMIRRSVMIDNRLRFPDGRAMGEDLTMVMAAACCSKTARVAEPLYHYRRTNEGAMTRNYSDRNLDELRANVDSLAAFISSNRPDLAQYIDRLKQQIKFPFLLMEPASRGFKLWQTWWPEANHRIMANRHMSLHSRVAQTMARWHIWPAVSLYRSLLSKLQ
ncbi:MAG: glycosyltransferase [Bacteroides sp.]|nr:glycosyltransferase [Bacteroides sp.]MCM1413243.1 glycosyltransferase [Bacteroides sp.]MCM1471447.1 glycosyltransferase [Bacteroides sp.]